MLIRLYTVEKVTQTNLIRMQDSPETSVEASDVTYGFNDY